MKTLSLIQGTPEWHQTRLSHFTASEAPAMMGASKYQKREELLNLKKTGASKPVSDFTQRLFDAGHAAEESARAIAENIIGDELFGSTGSDHVDGIALLASFDGITMDESIIWEHKLWNESLAAQISEGKIEHHYLWQIGQQLLVSGAEKCLFMTSDGTEDNMAFCWITPHGEFAENEIPLNAPKHVGGLGESWSAELMDGWRKFASDIEAYEPPVAVEADDTMQVQYSELSVLLHHKKVIEGEIKVLEDKMKARAKELGVKEIVGNGFKVSLVKRSGSVSASQLLKDKRIAGFIESEHIDINEFKSNDSEYYQIKAIEQKHA